MRDIDYGTVRIKLNELIEQQGISKNRLAHRAEMQRTQLNQYCNGEVTRLDIAVLSIPIKMSTFFGNSEHPFPEK